jgi:hypothetical protein
VNDPNDVDYARQAADEGESVPGGFEIGGNPGIQRHMRNTLIDGRIDGEWLL